MDVSAKELRLSPGKIIEKVSRGMDVFITYRGKRMAKIVPVNHDDETFSEVQDDIFGLWKNRDDQETVDEHVRKMRRGRSF